MLEKQKILLLGYYLPGFKVGGPLVSILNIVENLSNFYDFYILTPARDFGDRKSYPGIKKNSWVSVGRALVFYVEINLLTPFIILNQVKKNANAQCVIYLNSVFNTLFSILIVFAKRLNLIRIDNLLISPRGELFDEALGFKNWKKSLFLSFAKHINLYRGAIWHATTENEKNAIIEKLGIKPGNIRVALIMSNLKNDGHVTEITKLQDDIVDSNSLKIVYLSRISKDKNIKFTFDILRIVKNNIVFDIYGPIEDPILWEECQNIIKKLPINIEVNYKGIALREHVPSTLRKYDLFFLPTFAENYGHSIAEALSVGTPVLISDNTPWKNLEHEQLGWDINLTNKDKFVSAIHNLANYSNFERVQLRKHIQKTAQIRLNNPEILESNKSLFKLPY